MAQTTFLRPAQNWLGQDWAQDNPAMSTHNSTPPITTQGGIAITALIRLVNSSKVMVHHIEVHFYKMTSLFVWN